MARSTTTLCRCASAFGQVHTLLSREGMQSTASLSGALQRVWHAKGARGLLQGYWATNCVWLPWNVVYIASYEGLRKQARQALAMPPQDTLPAHVTAGAALVAASGAVIVTHPPDVVKTRLQVRCSGSASGDCFERYVPSCVRAECEQVKEFSSTDAFISTH